MATGAVPVRIRTAISLFNRKFTPGDATSRRDVPFAAGVRPVYGNPTLRAMIYFKSKYQEVLFMEKILSFIIMYIINFRRAVKYLYF